MEGSVEDNQHQRKKKAFKESEQLIIAPITRLCVVYYVCVVTIYARPCLCENGTTFPFILVCVRFTESPRHPDPRKYKYDTTASEVRSYKGGAVGPERAPPCLLSAKGVVYIHPRRRRKEQYLYLRQ